MTKRTPLTAQGISDRMTVLERQCLQAVREDAGKGGACDALRFLAQKAGLPEEGMCLFFVESARVSADQNAKRKPSPQDSTPEEVLSFARGLTNTSRKIRRLNKEAFWGAEHLLRSDATFQKLPDLLYMYARNVQLKAETFLRRRNLHRHPSLERKIRHRAKKEPFSGIHGLPDSGGIGSFQYRAEKELLETVQRLTGRMNREKVFSILRVIYPKFSLRAAKPESVRKREQRAHGKA